ncbi:SDR family NAD(P)-dependent oxidoreductase [Ciceribacter sp. L1K23]|uniref:SDR family NAD(P)-dependent oxidoreductase n=1 Tax=Ciceribacter sp. L1K23 TaxID=2820276 RepID=UPI001B842AB4|nr:SDR family NAD(P)-dependent oxidoreductase [Ciceribacter sp. L1K23]MBR0554138.1 SDR family NAD(P)-dependent oxidoreductase [Ciceribacter sp. L1K23]
MSRRDEVFKQGKVAVITGGASGIGFAAAETCVAHGMHVVLADLGGEKLTTASVLLAAHSKPGTRVTPIATDVGLPASIEALKQRVGSEFGPVHFLMNNAGIQPGSGIFGPTANWDKVLAVNLLGVINGSRLFGPDMIAHGEPAIIVNTGSKQGITMPPGDPAYNVAKAGVKAFTEALEHELRNHPEGKVSAHLLIPGFVFTPLTAGDRTEKPTSAWTPRQTVDFMMEGLGRGDFYILCPDNEVDRRTDELRMKWAVGDIVENRPPLSRWHPEYQEKFAAYLRSGKS